MIILGIEMREYSSAAIMVDGEVIAAAAEERFQKVKCWSGFPLHAVEYCLRQAGVSIADVNAVVVPELGVALGGIEYALVQRRSTFSVADYVREAHEYWYPKQYEGRDVDYLQIFRDKLVPETYSCEFTEYYLNVRNTLDRTDIGTIQDLKRRIVRSFYPDLKKEQIFFLPHHQCHAFYGFYFSAFANSDEPTLVVTADSWGDFENSTINIFNNRQFRVVHTLDNLNFGRLFRNITLLLGLKPYEHEFKVMGLAPYAPAFLRESAYEVFAETLDVDGLNFSYNVKPKDYYFHFRERLEGKRFDGIAAGLQKFYEEKIGTWFRNVINKFDIRKVCYSGGLACNIKCNMALAQMAEIEDFFVAPSPDDHSNCIGACFLYMHNWLKSNGGESLERIKPLTHAYLGPGVTPENARLTVQRYGFSRGDCRVYENFTPALVAQRLTGGKIIGRCSGRMEFGARALGNRSILADPRDVMCVNRINRIIKKRDFWMPFAPVILDTHWDKYLHNPKNVYSPYMTVGFETTDKARHEIAAGLHMSDFTTRAQMLVRSMNPAYYDIVAEFSKLTGVGSLLNTSFNLHGYPIVTDCDDAIKVFLESDLDGLILADSLYIEKDRG